MVEGPDIRIHVLVALPRFGNHHQDRFSQRIATHIEEFEHLVETRRVRTAGGAHRKYPFEVTGYEVGSQERLAGAHEVPVSLDCVDLAVVGNHPVWVGERPHGKGVGREPGVDEGQSALDPIVVQLGKESRHL